MGSKKLKILQAIRQGNIGGGETHVLDLVSNIDKSVFDIVVLSFTHGPMVKQLERIDIPVYVIETEQGFDWSVWKKVKKLMEDIDVDIVHAHGTRANSNVFWAAHKLKLPLIYTVHGWSFHQDQKYIKRKMRETAEKFLTSMATSTICVSISNQNDGIQLFNLKRSTVIYNGINTNKFNPEKSYHDIRKEFNISKDKTLIGFIVRMTIQKDPLTLITAMKIVLEQTNDIVLIMIGEGDLKDQAVQMVTELGLEANIIFENFRQDVPDILNAIDIYCLPSLWEGLPIGILEAMAMGKVVIATPIDGTKEILIHNQNGIIVPVKNSKRLAEAILDVHNDSQLRQKLSENAIKTIHEKFTLREMVTKVENHYYKNLKIK